MVGVVKVINVETSVVVKPGGLQQSFFVDGKQKWEGMCLACATQGQRSNVT